MLGVDVVKLVEQRNVMERKIVLALVIDCRVNDIHFSKDCFMECSIKEPLMTIFLMLKLKLVHLISPN